MEKLVIEPADQPTATFVKPQVYYETGFPTGKNEFQFLEQQ